MAAPVANGGPVMTKDDATGLKAPVSKKPPVESAQSIRLRALVVASFWAVAVLLGLPVWWWTTSIYRANLPLQEMLEWADGKVWLPASCLDGELS